MIFIKTETKRKRHAEKFVCLQEDFETLGDAKKTLLVSTAIIY